MIIRIEGGIPEEMFLNAFIPAAGIGERLRPITEYIPKPLLPVLGRSLLERTLERVSSAGVGRIGINLHHKGDAIRAWLEASRYAGQVACFREEVLLGTGGALKNAESLLGDGAPFLVHNADILTDIDLPALIAAHFVSGHIATLALHDHPVHNKVAVDEAGRVVGVGEVTVKPGAERVLAYTGIAVYAPAFLEYLPDGPSHAPDFWLEAVAAGSTVGSVDVTGCVWHDVGTPASYAAAVVDTLRRDGEWVYAAQGVEARDIDIDGYVAVETGALLEDGALLRNAVVLPGGRGARGARYENCIVGDGFAVSLREHEFLGALPSEHGVQIGVGGSGRRYFRAWEGGGTVVRMVCQPDEPDYERHMAYSHFFARYGVPVPKVLREDPDAKRAEFEDLGDLSLYNYLRFPRAPQEVEEMYRRVLESLVVLHVDASRHVEECPLLATRPFDFEYFRWETAYFLERFVEGVRAIQPESREALDAEFDRLAHDADALPKAVIHRDLQSQNIMITRGEPRFIDYQGARLAPPAYDIASVLWDPYYRIDDATRERLVAHYVTLRQQRGGFDPDAFYRALAICRLQRHMQALGAYGFLSVVKGKHYFRKHIPEGLRLLRTDAAETADAYPAIAALVARL